MNPPWWYQSLKGSHLRRCTTVVLLVGAALVLFPLSIAAIMAAGLAIDITRVYAIQFILKAAPYLAIAVLTAAAVRVWSEHH